MKTQTEYRNASFGRWLVENVAKSGPNQYGPQLSHVYDGESCYIWFSGEDTMVHIKLDINLETPKYPMKDGFWIHGQKRDNKFNLSRARAAMAYLLAYYQGPELQNAIFATNQLASWMGWPDDDE